LLVEEQTLLSGTLPRALAPYRIFLAGRLSLAAADRHADLRLSLIPWPDLGVLEGRPRVSLAP